MKAETRLVRKALLPIRAVQESDRFPHEVVSTLSLEASKPRLDGNLRKLQRGALLLAQRPPHSQ